MLLNPAVDQGIAVYIMAKQQFYLKNSREKNPDYTGNVVKKLTISGFFTGKSIVGSRHMLVHPSVDRGIGFNATAKIAITLKE